ncbi:DNA topoisomerase 3-alpha, partial [Turnera subulata]
MINKPSVAKSVAALLSRNQLRMREGRSRYNKIFEFNYSINGQQCHMLVTSVTGHLMELEFEDRFRKWHSCDPADQMRRGQAFKQGLLEIHEAVQNLVAPNQWFADAVDARQEIDLRIGASFTRFQTMLLRDRFLIDSAQDERNLVLSYGPCQFPTLGFVVERYWEIQAHEPEEFWTINCSHRSDEGIATFNWMRGHLFDYTSAVLLYEMCVEDPTATVTKVQEQEKLKYPPYPLSTLELEKRASRYFRMSSEHTMKVAEDLYQAGFISYPRTETDGFSSRTDLHAIVREQQEHPVWGSYAQRLLDPAAGLWRNPASGGHDDKAHPPIHPTKFSGGETNWSQDHHKNYLEVYRFESWGGSMIPQFTHGQEFIPTTLTLDSGVTRPPPLLSEADLLSCMDKAGIGTDATMHDHIKKLLDRSYATKDANMRFSPTNLGEALVMGYDDMGRDRSSEDDNNAPGEIVRPCGLCRESNMVLKRNRDGNFMVGCLGYPQCRNAIWLPGPVLEATVTTNICNSCTPGPVYLIQFKFRQLEIPPGFNVNHLGKCSFGTKGTV